MGLIAPEILSTQNGDVWVANGERPGVSVFDGEAWRKFTEFGSFSMGRVLSMTQTEDGSVWLGTAPFKDEEALKDKVRLLRYREGVWLRYLGKDDLGNKPIGHIAHTEGG